MQRIRVEVGMPSCGEELLDVAKKFKVVEDEKHGSWSRRNKAIYLYKAHL
jgi:hypothetical protein